MRRKLPSARVLQEQGVDVDVSRDIEYTSVEGEEYQGYFSWFHNDIRWSVKYEYTGDPQGWVDEPKRSRFDKDETLEELTEEILADHKKAIRTFDTGAIRDSEDGKEDYSETISWRAFKRYAQYMTAKKKKYGAGNFKKGMPIEQYEKSLLRHVQKYMENKYEGGTSEPDEDHLSALVFNIFGIMHEEKKEYYK